MTDDETKVFVKEALKALKEAKHDPVFDTKTWQDKVKSSIPTPKEIKEGVTD